MLGLIPNKREFLANALTRAGFVSLLEHAAQRPGLLVLTYHRIGLPSECPFFEGVVSASPEALRIQLQELQRHFAVISLDDLLARADSGFAFDRPSALVTFDDGYRDNIDVALPILQQLGVPATFFIPTAFLQVPRLPWWDHVAYVLKESKRPEVNLTWPEPIMLDLAQSPRSEAITRVIDLFIQGKVDDEPGFRRHLEEQAEVSVDGTLAGELFLSWDDVRRASESGVAIASHGVTHRPLGPLSEAEQTSELLQSRRTLEWALGRPIKAIAYPFGWPGTVTPTTRKLAAEAGYQAAFLSTSGINRAGKGDPMALCRLNVGFRDSPPLLRARVAMQRAFGTSLV